MFAAFFYSIKYCSFIGSIWNLLWSSEILVSVLFFLAHLNQLLRQIVNARKYATQFFLSLYIYELKFSHSKRNSKIDKICKIRNLAPFCQASLSRFSYLYLHVDRAVQYNVYMIYIGILWSKFCFISMHNNYIESTMLSQCNFFTIVLWHENEVESDLRNSNANMPKREKMILKHNLPKRKRAIYCFPLQRWQCNMLIIIFITLTVVSMPKVCIFFIFIAWTKPHWVWHFMFVKCDRFVLVCS